SIIMIGGGLESTIIASAIDAYWFNVPFTVIGDAVYPDRSLTEQECGTPLKRVEAPRSRTRSQSRRSRNARLQRRRASWISSANFDREIRADGAGLVADRPIGNDDRSACPEALRDAVADVLRDLDALQRLGGAGRPKVRDHGRLRSLRPPSLMPRL